ncbi:unnamed protein product [Auanema sp. JU1783]|nr:unnamed protein product [Auanema sp. JU1783]
MRSFVIYDNMDACKLGQSRLKDHYPGVRWIRFLTNDGYIFDIAAPLFQFSTVIQNMFEGLQLGTEVEPSDCSEDFSEIVTNDMPICLNFDGTHFEALLQALESLSAHTHHNLSDHSSDILISMLKIADFFDVEDLIVLIVKEIDSRMSGSTPDQIRENFNITNDFKKDELDQIKNEGLWTFNAQV